MHNRKSRNQPKGIAVPYDKAKAFEFFKASVGTLRRDWEAFSHLFMDKARRDFLFARFRMLAECISTTLTVAVYMQIAQLFDPIISMNDQAKANLVVRRVIDDIGPPAGSDDRDEIERAYKACLPTVEKIRKWRNVVGAHRSLQTSIDLLDYIKSGKEAPHPLPHIKLMKVFDVVQHLVTITDLLEDASTGGHFLPWYDPAITSEIDQLFSLVGIGRNTSRAHTKTIIPLAVERESRRSRR